MARKSPRSTTGAAADDGGDKVAFVTVGTTRFDALVQAATTPAALAALRARGFARLVLQIGASPEPSTGGAADGAQQPPPASSSSSSSSSSSTPRTRSRRLSAEGGDGGAGGQRGHQRVAVEWYRYKDSLRADMEAADLIISHAGAGSVMEALGLEKPLVVVVNAALMDGHQQELARAMEEQGYLVATDPAHLVATLQARRYEGLAARPAPTPGLLPALLDEEIGFVAVGGGGGARQGQGPEEVVEEAAAVGGGGTRRRGGRRSD